MGKEFRCESAWDAAHQDPARELTPAIQLSPAARRALIPETPEAIREALQCDATAVRIISKGELVEAGQLVGVRLNISVLKHTGVAVHSIHWATNVAGYKANRGFFRGEVINYLPVVVIRNAYFNVHQGGRVGIARGAMSKHPMASIDGTVVAEIDIHPGLKDEASRAKLVMRQ